MTKRYDVMSPRKRKDSEKPYWHRVGTAWEGEKGISITFDSLPIPDDKGEVRVLLFEPREKEATATSRPIEKTAARGSMKDQLNDDVPF